MQHLCRHVRCRLWPHAFHDQQAFVMTTPSSTLPAVLDRIDADLDKSLDRLFAFLKIKSISTDPAYKDQCKAAAEFVAEDLSGLGFDASLRPTGGHPVVVAKNGNGSTGGRAPRVL